MPLVDLRQQAITRQADELIEHLWRSHLELKLSAGIWSFSPIRSRFHADYRPACDIARRLDIAASLEPYGLSAIEAHYPNEINEHNLELWRTFARESGVRLLTVIPMLAFDQSFEHGSLSSPIPGHRALAIARVIESLQLTRELEADFSILWTGIDGFESSFGLDHVSMRSRYARGLAEAMDAVPGTRVAFEPKPYEPRGRSLYPLTAEGILLGHQVEEMLEHPENQRLLAQGHRLVCMNPEVGHVHMGNEDLSYALSWPLGEARLAHTHWNSQPSGGFDQDLDAGVISPEQTEAALYLLKMRSYNGYLGIDINPERVPVDIALKCSMDALRSARDRVEELDHELIVRSIEQPHRYRGWLEAHLLRARAPHPERLAPLAEAVSTVLEAPGEPSSTAPDHL